MLPETAQLLAQVAAGIRAGGFPAVIVGDVLVPDDAPWREALAGPGGVFSMHEELGIELFGREIWLGVLDYDLTDFELHESEEDGKLIVRPRFEAAREVSGRLHRGKLSDVDVPDGTLASPSEHRRRTGPSKEGG
jgi:hypothetical protein